MPDPLIVRTVLGDVRHLGTQYLASFERGELEVAVREGVVALQGTQAAEPRATAAAGEQLRLSAAAPQRIERGVVAAADARWDWIETVPAPLDIEGLSLDRFLQWYGRETGREVSLDGIDPQTRLHGSVAGLMPEDALDAIAAAVELEVIREDDGVVVRRR
jgi:ferric-dicitrate binding protein FerR (iron transport regulator)